MSLSEEVLWGKHKEKMIDAFAMESMSHRYGWTPKYIRELKETDNDTYMIYTCILAGESDSSKAGGQKDGNISSNQVGNKGS